MRASRAGCWERALHATVLKDGIVKSERETPAQARARAEGRCAYIKIKREVYHTESAVCSVTTNGGPAWMMAVLESWMQGVSDTGFIYSPIHGLSSCLWWVGGGRRSGRSSRKMAGWRGLALLPSVADDIAWNMYGQSTLAGCACNASLTQGRAGDLRASTAR